MDNTNHLSTSEVVRRALTTPSGQPRAGIEAYTAAALIESGRKVKAALYTAEDRDSFAAKAYASALYIDGAIPFAEVMVALGYASATPGRLPFGGWLTCGS